MQGRTGGGATRMLAHSVEIEKTHQILYYTGMYYDLELDLTCL